MHEVVSAPSLQLRYERDARLLYGSYGRAQPACGVCQLRDCAEREASGAYRVRRRVRSRPPRPSAS